MPKQIPLLFSIASLLLMTACDSNEPPEMSDNPMPESSDRSIALAASMEPDIAQVPAELLEAIESTPMTSSGSSPESSEFEEVDWDSLIPEDWRPDAIMAEYPVDELSDDDPRAIELMARLRELWDAAPVVPDFDGRKIKLPGFVVPLELDSEYISEFLLVPYYGACIHVPPPPANQTVHVKAESGAEYAGGLFDTVWVSGTISVEAKSSELGEAGYQIKATRIEPYLEPLY